MINKDAILAKISIIKNCLKRIKDTTKLDPDTLSNFDNQDIFVLNLQRAIQATIDISHKIISAYGYQMPNSYKMTFTVLKENNWIDSETCELMQKMSSFRNIAVHDYQTLDLEILKSILTKNLADFEKFYKQILNKLNGQN